jgi:HK97 family phage major capsid protein
MSKLQEILADIEAKTAEVSTLFDEADEKHNGEMPDDARERVKSLNREITDLEKRAVDLKGDDAIRAATAQRRAQFQQPVSRPTFPNGKSDDEPGERKGGRPTLKTFGQQFVENEEWQAFFKQIAPTGEVGQKTHVNSPSLLLPVSIKTLITGVSSTSGGAFVIAEESGIFDALGRRPVTLRDIISVRTTMSDLVEFVRQTSRENLAAPVAEATATGGSSGVKPEGGFAFERVQAPVKTIAEWVAATKRSLSDAGQLRGIIDDELRADLEDELNDQILNGSGVGENFEGIDTVTGTQDQAWSTNILTTTRKARTLVRTVGRATPTAYVLNPTDWETIDLLQDNEARYYYGGPSELGMPRLWGLPVVEEEAQPVGFGWVGDFKKAVLWDREQATMSVTDSHSDFFVRNLVAILGELRAAFGVIRPAAFVEMDLTA